MPAIYHEGSWLGNATDPEVLVKDTVGWTGKNRAYSQTNNAVIAHIENGITYDVSWTGSATVTLKKNSASGATITSGSTSPLSFTADADYELYFGSSATVTNIMVKDSRITDPTYEPYHESVEEEIEQIYADNGVLGAKNLLQITATTRTQDGVTITVNKDSSDNVLSVVLNGTATSSGQFNLNSTSGLLNSLLQKYGDLIWSGCPSRTDCRMYTHILNGSYVTLTNNEEKILSASNNYDTNILVQYDDGVTYDNVAFYPMLRLASDPDDTYQPYAMTNRELTEKVFEKRTLTSSDDLNNITETGIYGITTAPVNSPEATTYCTLLVKANSSNDIKQIIFEARSAGGYIYIRSYGSNTWGSWYKFTGTVVS